MHAASSRFRRMIVIGTAPVLTSSLAAAQATSPTRPAAARSVIINDVPLSTSQIAEIERYYRVRLLDGRYWYDRKTGAWGVWGGPVAGIKEGSASTG